MRFPMCTYMCLSGVYVCSASDVIVTSYHSVTWSTSKRLIESDKISEERPHQAWDTEKKKRRGHVQGS